MAEAPRRVGIAHQLDGLVCDLADKSWAAVPDFLPADAVTGLVAEIRQLAQAGALRPAGTGRGDDRVVRPEVRSDLIHWLGEGAETAAQQVALEQLQGLRSALNRQLFLGLRRFEGHLTHYPAGGLYRKHVDNFQGTSNRRVSVILYLNAGWEPGHGGQLRLYGPDGETTDIEPRAGTLACFLSAEVPHEVLTSARERLSLTGWFRDD